MATTPAGPGTRSTPAPTKSPYALFLEEQARRNAGQTPTPAGYRSPAVWNQPKANASATSYGGGGGGGANNKASADNLGTIAGFNAQSTKDQFGRAKTNYDLADQQNRQLSEVEFAQNSRKASGERFAQQKKLQSSTSGVLGAMGNAMQGSGTHSLIDMLRGRQDLDTAEVLGILTQNQNAVRNALDESLNTNVLARNDAASNAEFGLRGIEADYAAQLNNIDPKLFAGPGSGTTNLGSAGYANSNLTPANLAALAGYILPASNNQPRPAAQAPAGSSYFDKLLNSYNRRS